MAANPWGAQVGPLALGPNPDSLPQGAWEILPKFNGDGKKSTDEHLNTFNMARGVIVVKFENVVVKLFIQTLIEAIAD